MEENRIVGYLVNAGVMCSRCATQALSAEPAMLRLVALYLINVWPYSQHCHECQMPLVIGSVRTELFERSRNEKE